MLSSELQAYSQKGKKTIKVFHTEQEFWAVKLVSSGNLELKKTTSSLVEKNHQQAQVVITTTYSLVKNVLQTPFPFGIAEEEAPLFFAFGIFTDWKQNPQEKGTTNQAKKQSSLKAHKISQ